MDVRARAHWQAVGVKRVFHDFVCCPENTKVGIAFHLAELRFRVEELAEQFAWFAALALVYIHNGAFINAAVAHGQYYARIHVGNGVTQRPEITAVRVVEAQRTDTGGAVAYPRAEAVRAVRGIQRRFDADDHRFASAFDFQKRLAAFGNQAAELIRIGHVCVVDAHDAVAGADARQPCRAGRRSHVGRADHDHALGQKRHAHRLPAGDKRSLCFNRYRNSFYRDQAQQAVGERGLASLVARGEGDGVAQAGGALVKAGNDSGGIAVDLRVAGKREF